MDRSCKVFSMSIATVPALQMMDNSVGDTIKMKSRVIMSKPKNMSLKKLVRKNKNGPKVSLKPIQEKPEDTSEDMQEDTPPHRAPKELLQELRKKFGIQNNAQKSQKKEQKSQKKVVAHKSQKKAPEKATREEEEQEGMKLSEVMQDFEKEDYQKPGFSEQFEVTQEQDKEWTQLWESLLDEDSWSELKKYEETKRLGFRVNDGKAREEAAHMYNWMVKKIEALRLKALCSRTPKKSKKIDVATLKYFKELVDDIEVGEWMERRQRKAKKCCIFDEKSRYAVELFVLVLIILGAFVAGELVHGAWFVVSFVACIYLLFLVAAESA